MESKTRIHSVISGEIKYPATKHKNAFTDTQGTIEESLNHMYKQIISPDSHFNYTIHEDDFTVFISDPKKALKAVIYIGAFLAKSKNKIPAKSKVKMGTGIGKAKYPDQSFSKKEGVAFEYADTILKSMRKHELIRIQTPWSDINEEFEVSCTFAETLMKRWTVAQAEVVMEKIKGKNQTEIGKILQISQPAVAKHLMASNWEPIEKFLIRYYKAVYQNLSK